MTNSTVLESVLKKDRFVVGMGLLLMAVLAWVYMVYLAGHRTMPNASTMDLMRPMVMGWQLVDFLMMLLMWVVMMVAMMVPAISPMVLLYATISRHRKPHQSPLAPVAIFVSGYLLVWWGFAGLATLAQWWLHQQALLSSMMGHLSPLIGGIILILGGLFQWTPVKSACLNHCRSPLDQITSHWREGASGPLVMGLEHGAYCLGCCWFLMTLMFVAGVMNLLWMALIAGYILLEKVLPPGRVGNGLTWFVGGIMIVLGIRMVLPEI